MFVIITLTYILHISGWWLAINTIQQQQTVVLLLHSNCHLQYVRQSTITNNKITSDATTHRATGIISHTVTQTSWNAPNAVNKTTYRTLTPDNTRHNACQLSQTDHASTGAVDLEATVCSICRYVMKMRNACPIPLQQCTDRDGQRRPSAFQYTLHSCIGLVS